MSDVPVFCLVSVSLNLMSYDDAAGMALELASPLYPPAFLLLACLGSIARAITGVFPVCHAGEHTRGKLEREREGERERERERERSQDGIGWDGVGSSHCMWPKPLYL
jgi:hypothetical protein